MVGRARAHSWWARGVVGLLCPVAAYGQELSFDAHGAPPMAGVDGDLSPLRVWVPSDRRSGEWAAGVLAEADLGLLYRRVGVEGELQAVLGGAEGLNLRAGYAISRRIGVSATLPAWLATQGDPAYQGGFALGDAHVWVPVALRQASERSSLRVDVVPWADLPTGAAGRLLGDPRLGGGLLLAVAGEADAWRWSANLGVEHRPWDDVPGELGGEAARLAASGGRIFGDGGAIFAEATWVNDANTAPIDLGGGVTVTPPSGSIEAGLTGEGRLPGDALRWTLSAVSGIAGGLGTPTLRVYGGISWSPPPKDVPTIETTPLVSGPTRFTVRDPAGVPVVGAEVWSGSERLGVTGADGSVELATVDWTAGVQVKAAGLVEASARPSPDGSVDDVLLGWSPVPVTVTVRDQTGADVRGTVQVVEGPMRPEPAPISAGGQVTFDLIPGTYTLGIDAPGYGRQYRGVDVRPNAGLLFAEAYLAPDDGDARLGITVTDDQGRAVDARVVVDGRPVGTTGVGGLLELADLADAGHRVEVSAEGYDTVEVGDILARTDAPGAVRIPLQRRIGSVQVRVLGPGGQAADAIVRFEGPFSSDGIIQSDTTRLPPQPVGATGERIFVLRPGLWTATVASPAYGLQQREIIVPPDDNRLIVVDVTLWPAEDGAGRFAVRVLDPEGQPVEGATVRLDGDPVGMTSTGGAVSLEGLTPGMRAVTVEAPRHRTSAPTDVLITEALTESLVTLPWAPGTVQIRARGPAGRVEDATARFAGPLTTPPVLLGSDGEAFTHLAAGTWTAVVVTPSLGMQQRTLTIPADGRALSRIDVVFPAPEQGVSQLRVRVLNPEGKPLDGALVRLDGADVGLTAAAGEITLFELDPGPRRLEVQAEGMRAATQTLSLLPPPEDAAPDALAQEVTVRMGWAAGATRVAVTGPDGPVSDAIIRLAGPQTLPPRPVTADGSRDFVLAPGKWAATVVSPSLGLSTREFEVSASRKGLYTVQIPMEPLAEGEAELMLRVVDPDGRPIVGAAVRLGGAARGKTGSGGTLLLGSLAPGKLALSLMAPGYLAAEVADLVVAEGAQERRVVLAFEPIPVQVSVRDAAGRPVDAEVRVEGPTSVPPARSGESGALTLHLRPGTWQVVAADPALGAVRKELRLQRGDRGVEAVLSLSGRRVDVTEAAVVIREQVQFDFDSAQLQPEAGPILDEVAATLLADGAISRIEIQGHADDVGSVEANYRLSRERAAAVRDALIARGVAPERLVAAGYGATRPLVPNVDDASRARNRRVQFEITERTR